MKLTTINHVETSSICSNACQYCPSPHVKEHRPVGFMTMETFQKVMDWVDICVKRGTQTELNLHGIGEPTLNPHIVDFVRMAREHVPPGFGIHFNTNGNHMTDELAGKLKEAGISHIDVTLHNTRVSADCLRILANHNIACNISVDFVTYPHDWAGQVDWLKPTYVLQCGWVYKGMGVVLWDGTIVTCCIDAFATKKLGSVLTNNLDDIDLEHYELCKKCHHVPPDVWQRNRCDQRS